MSKKWNNVQISNFPAVKHGASEKRAKARNRQHRCGGTALWPCERTGALFGGAAEEEGLLVQELEWGHLQVEQGQAGDPDAHRANTP